MEGARRGNSLAMKVSCLRCDKCVFFDEGMDDVGVVYIQDEFKGFISVS